MTMENLYNELRRNLSELSELENRLKKSLSQALDGNLTVKHINGGSRFYVQFERNRLASQYLGNDKISTVTALAQKGYDAKILKEVEKTPQGSGEMLENPGQRRCNAGAFKGT